MKLPSFAILGAYDMFENKFYQYLSNIDHNLNGVLDIKPLLVQPIIKKVPLKDYNNRVHTHFQHQSFNGG